MSPFAHPAHLVMSAALSKRANASFRAETRARSQPSRRPSRPCRARRPFTDFTAEIPRCAHCAQLRSASLVEPVDVPRAAGARGAGRGLGRVRRAREARAECPRRSAGPSDGSSRPWPVRRADSRIPDPEATPSRCCCGLGPCRCCCAWIPKSQIPARRSARKARARLHRARRTRPRSDSPRWTSRARVFPLPCPPELALPARLAHSLADAPQLKSRDV